MSRSFALQQFEGGNERFAESSPIAHGKMLDALELDAIPFKVLLRQVRWTLARIVKEYAEPPADAASGEVEDTLTQAIRLWALHIVVDDQRYDFDLSADRHCIRDLEELFQTIEGRPYRARRQTRTDHFQNLCIRFRDNMADLRNGERGLRARLSTDSEAADWDDVDWTMLISTCFSAALNLEANYEARAFDSAEANS